MWFRWFSVTISEQQLLDLDLPVEVTEGVRFYLRHLSNALHAWKHTDVWACICIL